MPVPIVYRAGGDVQVNYDFADVISGTGYINYYAAHGFDSAASGVYFLSRNLAYYSQNVSTEGSGNAVISTAQKVLDLDFDYVLDRPLTINGEASINAPWSMTISPGAAHGSDGYIIAKIRKWDGSTETDLVEGKSLTISISAGAGQSYQHSGLAITVPSTHFKKGETIRLTIEGWVTYSGNLQIAHDPADRTSWGAASNVTATSLMRIPLRLDI